VVIAVVAALSFTAGLTCAATRSTPDEQIAERYAAAWARGDLRTMYANLTPAVRARVSRARFADAHRSAMVTATARVARVAAPERDGDRYRLGLALATRIFGTVRGDVRLAVSDEGVTWAPHLVFPGLRGGERLARTTVLPPRGTLLARDRTVLARGADRATALGPLADSVVGELGLAPPDRQARLRALGVPDGSTVGLSGLERIFDERLLGTPGGELRAGTRIVARRDPRRAAAVRTTISVPVQEAAVAALAGRLGGVVALDPRNGAILAFAGIAFSGLQPPGSTFKIITVTGALEAGLTRPSRTYPVQTKAVLEGVDLANANDESCGGTLVAAFALSCNSVFAPLGTELGAPRLVAVAERFGFNRPPGVPGAATSTIPPAGEIGDDLALGSSAIGQGRVQATALQMTLVAATIARRGRRPSPTLDLRTAGRGAKTAPVTSSRIARTVERLMRAVVRAGTGRAAAIEGVEVAGKTGTAELRTTVACEPDPDNPESCPDLPENDPTDTDAWFAAYAPAGRRRPRVAVGVLLVASGAGGDTAAPAARGVLIAALRATAP